MACGDEKQTPEPDRDAASETDAGAVTPDAEAPEPTVCPDKVGSAPKMAGDSVIKFQVAGVERQARVHLPTGYDETHLLPVVLNFHGSESMAVQQELYSGLDAKADAAGFIAVHPEGVGGSWNAGTCCDPAVKDKVDDVAYVRELINQLEQQFCVASRRVYATGMSNGAELAHRLACELPDRIAAIAPVAGGNLMTTCEPSRPIAILHMHGTADTEVPFEGDADHPPIPDTIAGWVERNGCTGDAVQTFKQGDTHCDTHKNCKGGVEVTLCTIEDGGHTWPGGVDIAFLGKTTHDLIANDAMWDFFQRFPRP